MMDILMQYGDVFTAIAAMATVLTLLFTRIIKPMWITIKNFSEVSDKINKIYSEVSPNGGQSLKDTIDQIDNLVQRINSKQRALVADIENPLFETDADGNYIWVNRTYARLAGRNSFELLGHGWQNAIAVEDRERVTKQWYAAADEEREMTLDYRIESPDGKITPCTCRSYKMTNTKGNLIGFLGYIVVRTELPTGVNNGDN